MKENPMRLSTIPAAATAALLSLAGTAAQATERGGSTYPPGAENYTCCALPPPGDDLIIYGESYRAKKLVDHNGNDAGPPGFSVHANSVAARYVHVFQTPMAGGSPGFAALLPVVDLDVRAGGREQKKTGVGDAVLTAGIGWHHSEHLHTLAGVNVTLPTGQYSATDLANIGRNYISVQPLAGVSYIDKSGFNADAFVTYAVNARNKDTDYRSGQELNADYSAGWAVGSGWVIGAGGYYYHQTTDDTLNGAVVPNAKGRAFAVGPSIRYDTGKGPFITLKYQRESGVRNRTEGAAFWLKAVVPL